MISSRGSRHGSGTWHSGSRAHGLHLTSQPKIRVVSSSASSWCTSRSSSSSSRSVRTSSCSSVASPSLSAEPHPPDAASLPASQPSSSRHGQARGSARFSLSKPALYGPRKPGSHPAAYSDNPVFVGLPLLNDRSTLAKLLAPRGRAENRPGKPRQRVVGHGCDAWVGSGTARMQRAVRLVAQSGAIDVEEMLEAVEFVERVRRRVRRSHMLDLAAGHGLVGLLLLAVNPQVQSVTFVDRVMPASFESLYAALASDPSLGVNLDRVTYFQCDVHELASAVETSSQSRNPWAAQRNPVVIEDVEQLAGQLLLWGRGNALGVVAVHACGALTDSVLVLASLAQAGSL